MPKILKTKVIFFTILFFSFFGLVKNASAATYYVSTSGNDSNIGISEETAWKNIDKVNKSSFQPGDNILFKRGEVWREQLTVSSSGSAGNPITLGAYGNGENPKILRTDLYNAWFEYSLISNGGFEAYTKGISNDDFLDLGEQKGPGANSSVTADTDIAYIGTSAKLYAEGTGSAFGSGDYSALTYWTGELKSDTHYYFSVWGRKDNSGDNGLIFRVKDLGSNTFLDSNASWQANGTNVARTWNGDPVNTWAQKTIIFKTPVSTSGVTTLSLAFYNFQNGSSWVDDAYLVEGTAPNPVKIWSGSIRGNSNYWGAVKDGKRIIKYVNYPRIEPSAMENGYFYGPLNASYFYYRNDSGNPGFVEIGARKNAILIRNKSFITIDGIDVSGPGGNVSPSDTCKTEMDNSVTGGCLLIHIDSYADNIIVKNSDISNSHSTGIWSSNTPTNIFYENIASHDNGSTGIYMNSQTGSIINSKAHDNCRIATDGGGADCGGIGSYQGGNILISDNEVYHNGLDGQNADFEISIVGGVNPFIVKNNYVHDCIQGCVQVAEGGDNSEIAYNIINGFGATTFDHAEGSPGKFAGIRIGGGIRGSRGVRILNNVITGGAPPRDETHAAIAVPNLDCSGLAAKNNIFYNNVSRDIYVGTYSYPITGYDFSSNIYFKSDYTDNWRWRDTKYSSLGDWQDARQLDLNSLADNPLFLNAIGNFSQAADFRLLSTSPAINTGTDVGLISDFDGHPIIGAPDIGAYEYQDGNDIIPPDIPTGLSVW